MIRGGLGALPGPLGKPRASGDDPLNAAAAHLSAL